VAQLQKENPRVAFVVAAGNESRDVCSVADVTSNGQIMMQWPQQRFGATISPYLFIGATVTGVAGGKVTQTLAAYSNYGSCVSALAPGGWWCAYRALPQTWSPPFQVTQGTSFASPATSGLLALVLAARPTASAADAARELLTGTRRAQGVPTGTTSALVTLPEDVFGPLSPTPVTTQGATTQGATTQAATTQGATTQAATTQAATTQGATTQAATTQGATTQAATTQLPSPVLPSPDDLAPRPSLAAPPQAVAESRVSYALIALALMLALLFLFFLLR
jgi:hypothetical protein